MGMSTSQLVFQQDYVYRILTYNVEWGFLKLPGDVNQDSCGHSLPHSTIAQEQHLKLISKNVGLLSPDICFLQEMGSIDAVETVSKYIKTMFNLDYNFHYSNDDQGYQGVGLLYLDKYRDMVSVEKIPNFPLNRALGLTLTYNEKCYKIVGVHLKSLYDHNYKKDVPEQLAQLAAVHEWIGDTDNSIVCGDLNNTPGSLPIQKMGEYGYTDIIDSDKSFLDKHLSSTTTQLRFPLHPFSSNPLHAEHTFTALHESFIT